MSIFCGRSMISIKAWELTSICPVSIIGNLSKEFAISPCLIRHWLMDQFPDNIQYDAVGEPVFLIFQSPRC